jgi:hypothetical protein
MHVIGSIVLRGFFAPVGLAAIYHAVCGKDFRFAMRGSREPGPRMPEWFARPFFSLTGAFSLWGAFAPWS